MNNGDKIFNLLEKVYIDLQKTNKELQKTKDEMRNGFIQVGERLDKVEKTVIRIENGHGQKLEALFDGYKQNSEKLDGIEAEVSKHEEIIM